MAELKAIKRVSANDLIVFHNWIPEEWVHTGCIEICNPNNRNDLFHFCNTKWEELKNIMFYFDNKKGWSPVKENKNERATN